MKTLTAYFSAEGTTAVLAKTLAETIHADLFEIKPVDPYSSADIRWTNPLARCNREKIGKKDVQILNTVDNWDQYDLVYLGFPIWYYSAPNIIITFCKNYDWTGKKVVLFATSGGSGIGKTKEKLMPYMKGNPQIINAQVLSSADDLKSLIY
ncbi:MAG: NAD(P)H-dependent oxidoreductase [Anaerolineaceae bacterium]|nr:NAD(P)H-dependent oxidoreductase [Anaerolineaceae bacterium]